MPAGGAVADGRKRGHYNTADSHLHAASRSRDKDEDSERDQDRPVISPRRTSGTSTTLLDPTWRVDVGGDISKVPRPRRRIETRHVGLVGREPAPARGKAPGRGRDPATRANGIAGQCG